MRNKNLCRNRVLEQLLTVGSSVEVLRREPKQPMRLSFRTVGVIKRKRKLLNYSRKNSVSGFISPEIQTIIFELNLREFIVLNVHKHAA